MSAMDDKQIVETENKEEETVEAESNSKSLKDAEKDEEAKLRAKYPEIKGSGSSALLQKRLSKGTKYFDSGDYNMAKAKTGSSKPQIGPGEKAMLTQGSTGEAIPTPESVPHRKISFNQKKLAGMS